MHRPYRRGEWGGDRDEPWSGGAVVEMGRGLEEPWLIWAVVETGRG